MMKAFYKVNRTDKRHRLALYIEGLRPEIKNQMLLMKSQNLQEAEQNAMIIEKTLDQEQQNLLKIVQIQHDKVQKQREISAIQEEVATAVVQDSPEEEITNAKQSREL